MFVCVCVSVCVCVEGRGGAHWHQNCMQNCVTWGQIHKYSYLHNVEHVCSKINISKSKISNFELTTKWILIKNLNLKKKN